MGIVLLIGFIGSCLMTLLTFFSISVAGSTNREVADGVIMSLPAWFAITLWCAYKMAGG